MSSFLERLAAKPYRSILALSLLLLLAGNWILPLTDRDEARFGEASREMLQRHDYVVPWFNGQWRFDKPVLIYWCQSASYRLFGANEFGARLPSVLFTTATALLLVRWGRRIADAKTAFMGGAIFIAGLHVAIIGRVATADMAMVFFVTLAVFSGWELTRPVNPHRMLWWWIFYVTLAFGFLAKGPVAWLPIGGMILGRVLQKDSYRLPASETILGLCVASGLSALWGVPAMIQTNCKYWDVGIGEHVVHRAVAVNDSHGIPGWFGFIVSFPVYFLTFLVSFLPWTIHKPQGFEAQLAGLRQKGPWWSVWSSIWGVLLWILYVPVKIWRWWPERKRDAFGWYLMAQAAIVFVAFSCVLTKLPHYTMPAFPCVALWLALQLRTEKDSFAWFQKRLVIMFSLVLAVMLGFTTYARNHILSENLWNAVKSNVRPETKVGCFGFVESSLVWKFRAVSTNLVALGEVKDARDFLTNTPPYILVLPTKQLATLPDTNGLQIQVHGLDMVKLKDWNLTAIVR